MTEQNVNSYPYWYPTVQAPRGNAGQDTRRMANNQTPLHDNANQEEVRVVMTPVVFQDTRSAADGDQAALGVGGPDYLFQRLYASPVLNPGKEAK